MLRILKSNLIMRGLQIVKNVPQKQHTLPAHVLLNASEDLFGVKRENFLMGLKIDFEFENLGFLGFFS